MFQENYEIPLECIKTKHVKIIYNSVYRSVNQTNSFYKRQVYKYTDRIIEKC